MRLGEVDWRNSWHGAASFLAFLKQVAWIVGILTLCVLGYLDQRYARAEAVAEQRAALEAEIQAAERVAEIASYRRQLEDYRTRLRIARRRIAREPTGSARNLDLQDEIDVLTDQVKSAEAAIAELQLHTHGKSGQ